MAWLSFVSVSWHVLIRELVLTFAITTELNTKEHWLFVLENIFKEFKK